MRLVYSALFFLIFFTSYSQNNVNQWGVNISLTKNNTLKKDLILKITDHYLYVDKQNDSVSKYLNTNILINGDSLFVAEKLYRSALLHSNTAAYDLALEHAKKASVLFDKYEEHSKSALAKRQMGNIYQTLFKNQEALIYFKKAEPHLKGKERIRMLIGLGAVYSQMNELDKSISHYNEAFKASEEFKDNSSLFNIHNGMASVYAKNEDFDKTKESYRKALKIAEQRKNYLGQLICNYNLGFLAFKLKEIGNAKSYFENAFSLFDKTDNSYLKASTYFKYAETQLELGNISLATENLEKSELLFNKMKSTGRIPYVLNVKAAIELKKGNINDVIKILEKAIEISSKNEIVGITSKNYFDLANAYKQKGDAVKTFVAFEKYTNINDSITSIKKNKDIETVRAKFEASELENKLKQDVVLLSVKNKSSYYRNLLFAVTIIGLMFFLYRQRKINQVKQKTLQQEKEIISLNEVLLQDKVKHSGTQITEYAILIDERNQFLDKLNEQMKDIRSLSNDSTQKSLIIDLQFFIRDIISVKKGKVDLDKNVEKSEEDFNFKLEQRFPKLTDKEIIVSRLLVINLTSKQIAQKMEITVQSVNNYRASIRKKINLEPGVNLKRFLKQV